MRRSAGDKPRPRGRPCPAPIRHRSCLASGFPSLLSWNLRSTPPASIGIGLRAPRCSVCYCETTRTRMCGHGYACRSSTACVPLAEARRGGYCPNFNCTSLAAKPRGTWYTRGNGPKRSRALEFNTCGIAYELGVFLEVNVKKTQIRLGALLILFKGIR
jgi:hypothetical protein